MNAVMGRVEWLAGAGVLGEHLQGRQLLGMLGIALGLAAIDGRPGAALRLLLAARCIDASR